MLFVWYFVDWTAEGTKVFGGKLKLKKGYVAASYQQKSMVLKPDTNYTAEEIGEHVSAIFIRFTFHLPLLS